MLYWLVGGESDESLTDALMLNRQVVKRMSDEALIDGSMLNRLTAGSTDVSLEGEPVLIWLAIPAVLKDWAVLTWLVVASLFKYEPVVIWLDIAV